MKYQNRTNNDWKFSDKVHQYVLENEIYNHHFFNLKEVTKATKREDQDEGIDYWAVCSDGRYSIQERFRELSKYTKNSLEFTLRYERNGSISNNQKKSEFFKIKANYLLYGITENQKVDSKITGLKRFVFINIQELYKEINNGNIIIDENKENRLEPYVNKENIPCAIVKKNHENKSGNSSLVIFNVSHLYEINKNIVFSSEGYLPEEIEKKKNPTKSPLSHLYPSKFEYKDYTFVSNEQFLMFVKAKKFGDEEASKKIIEMNNQPLIRDFIEGNVSKEDIANNEKYYEKWKEIMKEIKKIGAEVKNVNTEEWEQKLPKFRFVGAKEKFKQNEDLKKFLMTVDKNHIANLVSKEKFEEIVIWVQQLQEEFSQEEFSSRTKIFH